MQTPTLSVINTSKNTPIYISFQSPEDANVPEPPNVGLEPGQKDNFAVKNGIMNLFVWSDRANNPIWTGVIPTNVKKSVLVSPETAQVIYNGRIIPGGFDPSTDADTYGFVVDNNKSEYSPINFALWGLIIFILVCAIYWYIK